MSKPLKTANGVPVILIVEENDALRDSIVLLLRGWGYQASAANTPEYALELLERGLHPCLILLGRTTPTDSAMDFQSAQAGDARLAKIPTVGLSGVDARQDLRGIVCSLPKPIESEKLLELVHAHC